MRADVPLGRRIQRKKGHRMLPVAHVCAGSMARPTERRGLTSGRSGGGSQRTLVVVNIALA
jgi:hypothetical protein